MTDSITLEIGQQAAPVTIGPISRTDIVRYAGASGDFNPIHHDEEVARSAGFPGVFAMGMLPAGLLAGYAVDWLGPDRVRRFTTRFKEQVWPGDVLTCTGTVSALSEGSDGSRAATIDLVCRRQDGGIVVTSTAIFEV